MESIVKDALKLVSSNDDVKNEFKEAATQILTGEPVTAQIYGYTDQKSPLEAIVAFWQNDQKRDSLRTATKYFWWLEFKKIAPTRSYLEFEHAWGCGEDVSAAAYKSAEIISTQYPEAAPFLP